LHAQVVGKGPRTKGRQHVVHGNVRDQIPDAHCDLTEPIHKGPQRLSILLADAYQGDGGQMVRPAGRELSFKLSDERGKAIDGVGWEFGEPTEGCTLQGSGEHSAQYGLVRDVETHMDGVGLHMLVWVGRPVIPVSVETLPLLRQWDFNDVVGKGMSAVRVGRQGRPGGPH